MIHSTLDDARASLGDAFPLACIMPAVLMLVVAYSPLSLALLK